MQEKLNFKTSPLYLTTNSLIFPAPQMTQNNIKTLIQCEKEARELIADARKERETLKKKAKRDALEIVQRLCQERDKMIERIKEENDAKLKVIAEEITRESESNLKSLDGIEIAEMIDIIVGRVHDVYGD